MLKPKVLVVSFLLGVLAYSSAFADPLLSESDRQIYRSAFAAAAKEQWKQARALAHQAHDKLLLKALKWAEYANPRSDFSFQEIAEFAHDNPDWPQPSMLARRVEDAMGPAESTEAVLAWFVVHPPLTPNGKMAWARTLVSTGRQDKARTVIRESWISDNFGAVQEQQFLKLYGNQLRKEDHLARLDRLLWDHKSDLARKMIPKVDPAHRLLAQARILLAEQKPGAEAAVAKVPPELRNDPGLRFERVSWRRKKELYADAIALLPTDGKDRGYPKLWWKERAILAREALHMGHISNAYDIARQHGPLEGTHLAEAEWLAGWIALRSLRDAGVALGHFKHMLADVASPMSRSRGAYWAGRASEEMGDKTQAEKWYREAAAHVTSYYGQLAASRLDPEQKWPLPEDPVPTAEDIADFERSELARVTTMLAEIEARDSLRPFVLRLIELAKTPGQHALAAKLAHVEGRPDIGVSVARRSAQRGVTLLALGFPALDVEPPESLEKALVLSVIRQESNFNPAALSSAGAMGLMQLLPATAKQMAKAVNVPFAVQRLTHDPKYNTTLGSAFLSRLIDSFNGSYVLAIASYNAGPSRARQWMREQGDPRQPVIDAIDWVEMIPFSETRNYVQRILECLQVYRQRLGTADPTLSLEKDLKR